MTKISSRGFAAALARGPEGPPSRPARVAGQVCKALGKWPMRISPDVDAYYVRSQRFINLMGRAVVVPRSVDVSPENSLRRGSEWVRAGAPDEEKVLLYLHGSGYVIGNPQVFRPFLWRLSAATARPVLAVSYRLAPTYTPADALTDALEAYALVLARGYKPENVVVGGDSAGGHLALALLLALKERDQPLPRAAVCISPWVDMTCSAESHTLNRRSEALLAPNWMVRTGRKFGEGRDDSDPLHAPHRADLSGLPPLMLIAGGSEILRDDSRQVARRARAAGVEVVHQEWAGMMHCFPVGAAFIPEGKAAIRRIAGFLRTAEGRA